MLIREELWETPYVAGSGYALIKLSMLKTRLRRMRRFGVLTWMFSLRLYSFSYNAQSG